MIKKHILPILLAVPFKRAGSYPGSPCVQDGGYKILGEPLENGPEPPLSVGNLLALHIERGFPRSGEPFRPASIPVGSPSHRASLECTQERQTKWAGTYPKLPSDK